MSDSLEVLLSCSTEFEGLPAVREVEKWARAAYQSGNLAQVSIRIVDEQESQTLNLQYRHNNQPTNVLSFPMHADIGGQAEMLGDLAICAPVVQREADEQGKSCLAHWAHMVVHGMLHLQGYDHEDRQQAEVMENLEIGILSSLGFENPY
jgi:probable rRNA maturation factor